MTTPITSFRGSNRFLSNFYPSPILFKNYTLATVEHGYQGMKTKNLDIRHKIFTAASPAEAKRLGQSVEKGGLVELRDDWPAIRVPVMRFFTDLKYAIPELAQKLIDTNDEKLIEGNTWHDIFWGKCHCHYHGGEGENMLGQILMAKRETLRSWM